MLICKANKNSLLEVARRLKENDIPFALGGSGLLHFLGCKTEVNDWDITTDAPEEKVKTALAGLSFTKTLPNGIFATKYLFKISLMNTSIDLMGGFALRTTEGIFQVPTTITDYWEGIPIGSPEAWVKVYELMGRKEKAELLRRFLENNSPQ